MTAKDKAAIRAAAVREYQKTRRNSPDYPAKAAWDYARHAAKASVLFAKMEDKGLVRFRVQPDEDYNPADIGTREEEPETWDAYERDGAWGTVGEYWDGESWQVADSCWGHVGYKDPSDPYENAYAADIMLATIAAAHAVKHCPKCHRPIHS